MSQRLREKENERHQHHAQGHVLELHDRRRIGIVWLTLDKPGTSANVLSSEVLIELDALLRPLQQSAPRGVVVLSGKKSGFVAGADIKEFTGITDAESGYRLIHGGQQVLDRLEALPCPTVAAIHGFALGGGLELALACRYRVAVGDEKLSLGLPEVLLGIHPGFGGTVRTVRLAGVRAAMEMMLTGQAVACRSGAACWPRRQTRRRSGAAPGRRARFHPHKPAPRQAPFGQRILSSALLRPFVRRALIAQVAAKARREHYPAPYAIIDLWSRFGAQWPGGFRRPRRARSRTCSPRRPRATWCGCSCCRIA